MADEDHPSACEGDVGRDRKRFGPDEEVEELGEDKREVPVHEEDVQIKSFAREGHDAEGSGGSPFVRDGQEMADTVEGAAGGLGQPMSMVYEDVFRMGVLDGEIGASVVFAEVGERVEMRR